MDKIEDENEMNGEFDDPSMNFLDFNGVQLATKDIAVALSEMVIESRFGKAELNIQKPLSISDGGDRWIVEGTRDYDESAPRSMPQVVKGPVIVHIIKRNCRIVSFIQMSAFSD